MASIPMTCAIHPDGSRVKVDISSWGIDGFILLDKKSTDSTVKTVLKIPKLYERLNSNFTTLGPDPDNIYAHDLSREKAIYERLHGTPGIANYLGGTKDGILLEYYPTEDLAARMEKKGEDGETLPPPSWSQRERWILQILDICTACHAKKVFVRDIALRNLLLANDNTIRAIDFGQSEMYSLEHTGELKDSERYTERAEVFNVANIVYSLSRWERFELECINMEEWPDAKDLPSSVDLPLENVTVKAWSGQIENLEQLREAVVSVLSEEIMCEKGQPPHSCGFGLRRLINHSTISIDELVDFNVQHHR
jgi:serine/threonine protein kinase